MPETILQLVVFAFLFLLTAALSVEASPNAGFAGKAYSIVSMDPEPRIWKVDFKGNKAFNDLVLRDVVAAESPPVYKKMFIWKRRGPVFSETEIKKDVIRLERFYQRRGYQHVKVAYNVKEANRSWKKEVNFKILEGFPILVESISADYQAPDSITQYLKQKGSFQRTLKKQYYQVGKPYAVIREPDVKGALVGHLKNMGFAYADVNLKVQVDSAQNEAAIHFNIKPGPRTYIDSIQVTGRYTVTPDLIRRSSGLVKQEQFSEKRIQKAQRKLFNHHLFRFATISIPEQPQDSSLTLLIRVREEEERSVGLMVGFGREEWARGQVNWTHRNVGQHAHRFNTTAHASFIEQQLSFDYLFPYLFNANSSFLINPFGQHLLESNFELYRMGINNSLIYQYSRNLTGSISYVFTRNFELTRNQFVDLPDTTRDYNISAIQLSGYYNSNLQQDNGWVVRPYLEVSGFLGNASFDFQKFVLDVRRYVQLNESLIAAARFEAGSIFYNEADSLPNHIRFYAGGTNSVRGWDRNMLGPKRAVLNSDGNFKHYVPLGGRALFAFNVELRQELDFFLKGLGMAVFFDGGQVWREIRKTGNRPLQYSTGGGIRYNSPIGPVRVDVGYKLNPTRRDLDQYRNQDFGNFWDEIAFHFSIGQSF